MSQNDLIKKVRIPEDQSGIWSIEKFVVSDAEAEFDWIRHMAKGIPERACLPGCYTRLMRGETVIMSDTPAEISDHVEPVKQAARRGGSVLINGLGLGMVAAAILELGNVTDVTIVEKDQDVINLVWKTLHDRYGDRVKLIHADALIHCERKDKGRYSVVWHDIWDTICSDNVSDMMELFEAYKDSAWQGAWCEELCQELLSGGEYTF